MMCKNYLVSILQ